MASIKNKETQTQQVIKALRQNRGYATLGRLYQLIDTSAWNTKTPNESIRRIVQISKEIFKIQSGLWALEEYRAEVLAKFELKDKHSDGQRVFTHGYYQGLLIEIGNMKNFTTYIPRRTRTVSFSKHRSKTFAAPRKFCDSAGSKWSTASAWWTSFGSMSARYPTASSRRSTLRTFKIPSLSFATCKTITRNLLSLRPPTGKSSFARLWNERLSKT